MRGLGPDLVVFIAGKIENLDLLVAVIDIRMRCFAVRRDHVAGSRRLIPDLFADESDAVAFNRCPDLFTARAVAVGMPDGHWIEADRENALKGAKAGVGLEEILDDVTPVTGGAFNRKCVFILDQHVLVRPESGGNGLVDKVHGDGFFASVFHGEFEICRHEYADALVKVGCFFTGLDRSFAAW